MTLTERVKETMKRLDFVTTMKMSPDDWHGFLVNIIKDARQDGAEDEREACEKILEDQEALCRPNGSGEIKGGYIALHDAWLQIRARSS